MVIGNLELNGGRPHRGAPTNKGTDVYGNLAIKGRGRPPCLTGQISFKKEIDPACEGYPSKKWLRPFYRDIFAGRFETDPYMK